MLWSAMARVIVWPFDMLSIVVQFAAVAEFVEQISSTIVPMDAPPMVAVVLIEHE